MRIALALAAVLLSTPALAHPSVDAFQSVCVKNAGDGKAALGAADAAGWMIIPEALMKELRKEFPGGEGRMRSDANGLYLVIVGEMAQTFEKTRVNLKMCAIASMPATEAAAIRADVQTFAAVAPEKSLTKGGELGYVFTEEGGVHKRVDNIADAILRGMLADGRLRFVFYKADREMVLVAFAVPEI